jgi:predicted Zn finger-like uncharacterized protein
MLIVCPSCATAYDVEPIILQRNGRQVRCVRCRTVWSVEMSGTDELLAAAAALAPEAAGADDSEEGAAKGAVSATTYADLSGATEWPDAAVDAHREESDPLDASEETGTDDDLAAGSPSMSGGSPGAGAPAEVEAPPIAPVDLDTGRTPADIDADHRDASAGAWHEDVETAAARRFPGGAARRGGYWALSRWQVAILVLIIVDAILIGWRRDFVRVLPQTASFYAALGLPVNLRGLSFDELATRMEARDGVPILVVQGDVLNDTGGTMEVPRLKFIVRNAARQELYSWTAVPSQPQLAPYQAEAFTARLASPPPGSHDVLVRFLSPRDFLAGER